MPQHSLNDEELLAVKTMYLEYYDQKYEQLVAGGMKIVPAERDAQKYAIRNTILHYFSILEPPQKSKAWSAIYSAHVGRKAGVEILPDQIIKVISADQSWKKSSGHAFEEVVKELSNRALGGSGIELVLQRDIGPLLRSGVIQNDQRDLEWLQHQLDGSVFDLFAIKDGYIFGCIQAKTSIRDRVTRDREPSMSAMDHFYWSVVFVLDGDFLRLPKFQYMVNGGSAEFVYNGWHGLYAFSLPSGLNTRIHLLDADLNPFRENAESAARDWFHNRQWFNKDWLPQ